MNCTDERYIDSIEDPFFESLARQVVGAGTDVADAEIAASANRRLEDLEVAVRRKLLVLLQETDDDGSNYQNATVTIGKDGTAIADAIGVYWKSFLDLCHHLLHHALASSPSEPGTGSYQNLAPCRRFPYILLSDCIEGLPTVEDAELFWGKYVEPELNRGVLFGDKFWSQLTESNNEKKLSLPSSHLPFLKVANQFLKRLEHASVNRVRAEWKGRIMWALSKGFSIADKSSLKPWGSFHASNDTDFESKEEFNQHVPFDASSSAGNIEYNLYEAFWSLQNDFANPNKINVGDFIKRLRLVLAAMESATTISGKIDENGSTDQPTPKYLTSSSLLPSQIRDRTFRSNVVTQFLITASHLGAESPPLKNALAGLLGRACKLLKKDKPRLYGVLWDVILGSGREDNWRSWKKRKCAASSFAPNTKRKLVLGGAPTPSDDLGQISRDQKRKRTANENDTDNTHEEIVSSLSRAVMDNQSLFMESKDAPTKLPTLEEHLEPYVDALDPESGIEDEYHPKNDSLFTWRAMRLYAKHQLTLMSQCRQPSDLEKVTREWHRRTHGTSIPGETSPADKDSSSSNDDDKSERKDDASPADIGAGVDRSDKNQTDTGSVDTEMKDSESMEAAQKQGTQGKKDQDGEQRDTTEEEEKVVAKMEEDANDKNPKDLGEDKETVDSTEKGENETDPANEKKRDQETKEETSKKDEPAANSKATKPKNDAGDPQKEAAKTTETSKSNTASGTPTDTRSNDDEKSFDKNRNSKNDRQEKRTSRDSSFTQARGGGWRGNDGGRNNLDRGRRNDDPAPRRRNDDNHPSRGGGRSGGETSYRGRSDGQPQRGGRYDDDYRGDNSRHHGGDSRGDRFSGERTNRLGGKDNQRMRDRSGGTGRDDHRDSGRGGDRRSVDNRSRSGGDARRGRR